MFLQSEKSLSKPLLNLSMSPVFNGDGAQILYREKMKPASSFWRTLCLCLSLSTVAYAPMAIAQTVNTYTVSGNTFQKNGVPTSWRGVNAMHVFGGDSSDMNSWGVDIVREPILNMRDTPLTGYALNVGGTYLHSLQNIVNDNRANGKVTILCPFGWDGTSATEFLGQNPSKTTWWSSYKKKYQAIARQFKNQPDVWFEVWNEPYWHDRSHSYSDALWLSDMKAMVDNIRSTGATNIVLVPGAETGQDESVLIAKGPSLLAGRNNIAFDIHAYEKWLEDPQTTVENRIQNVKNAGLAMLFGEVAPLNAGILMNPANFLAAARTQGSTVSAWLWKYDGTDTDALLNSDGTHNDNSNNNWGSIYRDFTLNR
jgi:mannan endo-1,4-beta-mannosidase